MSEIAKVIVATFFALNQYLPESTQESQHKKIVIGKKTMAGGDRANLSL